MRKREKMKEIKLCGSCYCMTYTKAGYIYICAKCGKDRRGNKHLHNNKKQNESYTPKHKNIYTS